MRALRDERESTVSLIDRLRKAAEGIAPKPEFKLRPEVLCCPNVPKPLHRVCPRTILGRAWWDATRQAAYASTGGHCIACGVNQQLATWRQWLEGHELYRIDYPHGRMTYVETVPLCHLCHCFIHDGRLRSMIQQGKETPEKLKIVLDHGRRILAAARIQKPPPYSGKTAEWGSWRLVLKGKQYPPLYRDYREWLVGHGLAGDE